MNGLRLAVPEHGLQDLASRLIEPQAATGVMDNSASYDDPFRPPVGDIEAFLARVLEIGGDVVDLDGMVLPRIHEPVSAEDLEAETAKAVAATEPGAVPLHPGRYVRYRLEVAYMLDIRVLVPEDVSAYLMSREKGQTVSRPIEGPDVVRYRGVDRLRAEGRRAWAERGAWPWTLYRGGKLPSDWRLDPKVASALTEWHRRALDEATLEFVLLSARMARARKLHQRN